MKEENLHWNHYYRPVIIGSFFHSDFRSKLKLTHFRKPLNFRHWVQRDEWTGRSRPEPGKLVNLPQCGG